MAAVGVVLVVAGIVLVRTVEDRLVNDVRQRAQEALEAIPTGVALEAPIGQFVTYDPARPNVLVVSGTALPGMAGVPPSFGAAVIGPDGTFTAQVQDRVVAAAAVGEGDRFLFTALSLDQALGTIAGLRTALWIGIPVLVALIGLLAWLLVGRALRPVERIRAEVDDISHGTLHRRVVVPATDDELARLAGTMNDMLDRLDDAASRQRRFVSDAAHELRSPLACIRTTVEVAVADPSPARWDGVAGTLVDESDRLGQLIDDLLALALLDEGSASADNAEVDLDDLVRTEVQRQRAAGRAVELGSVTPAKVRGDMRMLERAIRNLIDNAVRHACSRVQVGVEVRDDGGTTAVLSVDDDGPGIPAGDRERVFERFARLDEGRARDAGGSGLGLAVVRAVAERHRGTAVAGTGPFGGAHLELRLPCLPCVTGAGIAPAASSGTVLGRELFGLQLDVARTGPGGQPLQDHEDTDERHQRAGA
jgi:signal transduction histidine kinase